MAVNPYVGNYPYYPYGAYPAQNSYVSAQNYQTVVPGMVVNWVASEDEAKNSYVAAGSNAYFMNKELPVIYMKSVDQSGRVLDFKAYDLVERKQEVKQDPKDDLREYVAGLVAQAMSDAGWKPRKKKEEE